MEYAVYADLPRPLTKQERAAVFEALDETVPGSGCVGLHRGSKKEEVYFSLMAPSEPAAIAQADRYMREILHKATLEIEYTLGLQLSFCAALKEPNR